MSATTLDQQQTTTEQRDLEISEAIHKFGDMYYQGHVPELKYTGQPIEIHVVAASAAEVENFARFNDIDVSHVKPGDGTYQTVACLTLAPNAVIVRVVNIRAAA